MTFNEGNVQARYCICKTLRSVQTGQYIHIRSAALGTDMSVASLSIETNLGPQNSKAYWGCYKTMMSMFLKYSGVLLRRTFGCKKEEAAGKFRKLPTEGHP